MICWPGFSLLRRARAGAVSEEDVGASFRHVPAIDAAAGGRVSAGRSARELQRLSSSDLRLPAFTASALANTAKA